MNHKVTIKDVAREAGVSVATVSYVVNDRTDLRISDTTRKKVLQVINLLNYTPNQAAKALATNRKNLFAFFLSPDCFALKKAEQLQIIQFLSHFLHQKGYDLLFLSDSYHEKCDKADAIICYDISSEQFHMLGDSNFIPLTALDCIINDPLFFQINTDYEQLAKKADSYFQGKHYRYVTLETPNLEKETLLKEQFDDIQFISTYEDIINISSHNLLITDATLKSLLEPANSICYIPSMSDSKADMLLQCIENALLRNPIDRHNILVAPSCSPTSD
jgi:DNA-binding LacI/PurR family transcriptional regulator